jgi:hypothetical protein
MESYPYTALAYATALLFAFFFAHIAEKYKNKKNKTFFYGLAFIVIILFCGLRFFVGNDYSGYYYNFQRISTYNLSFWKQRWEPGIYVITQIFKNCKVGYFFFLFTCSLLTYIFIFKTLVYNNVLKWGVFFTFTLGLLIMANDQVRQAVSLSIFLYSIKYIELNNFKTYLKWMILATLFHYTAIVLIPIFFLKNIKLNSFIFSILIIVTYIGFRFGIFYDLIFALIEKIPYYGELYLARERFFEIDQTGSGLTILFKTLIALFVAVFYNKINKPIYATLFLYGSILANISVGFMPIERFSYYLVYTNIIVLPLMLKHNFTKPFTKGLVVIASVYFLLVSFYGLEKHGAVPYRTIFYKNVTSPKSEYIKPPVSR